MKIKKLFIYSIAFLLINATSYSQYSNLLNFAGTSNGAEPSGSLISDGTFMYGMTREGGSNDLGTIFKILPDGTGYVKLFDFAGSSNGSLPMGSLMSDGTFLYGMTEFGGINNQGTIFKILLDGTGFVKLKDFAMGVEGRRPFGSLIYDGTYLFGMTWLGGNSELGVVFKVMPDGTNYTVLQDFANSTIGREPLGNLITDGTYMYGMTTSGGLFDAGTIFKILPNGSGFVKLFDFTVGSTGYYPYGSLFFDGVYLYGMTNLQGQNNNGTIFKILPDGSNFTVIHDFGCGLDGAHPEFTSLISDGTFLYGMTRLGGLNDEGIIFKIMPNGSSYQKLFDFSNPTGINPDGSLMLDGNFLYGMTAFGGTNNLGTLFKYNLPITNNNLTYCEGETIQLNAPSGANYLWSGPNSFTSTTQNPVISSATTNMSGTYSVTVTDAYGCSYSSSISVTVNPVPTASISGPQFLCEMSPNTILMSSPNNLQNIVWSTTPSYSFSGQGTNSIIPSSWPSNQGDITVNVTVTNQLGCSFSQSLLIEECCLSKSINLSVLNGEVFEKTYLQYSDFQGQFNSVTVNSPSNVVISLPPHPQLSSAYSTPFSSTINAGQLLTLTGSAGSTITSNNWIFINNDVIVNQDLNIINCPFIRIAPGIRFIVNSGVTLNIQNSTLAPKCEEMWGGIYLSTGTSNLICNQSNILAANIGVESIGGAPFDIDNTNFIDNYNGIKVQTYSGLHPGRVNKCYFGDNSTGNLLAPYSSEDKPMIGILAQRVNNILIGDVIDGGNTFHRQHNGILTRQCNLDVRSNTFFQIVEDPTVLTSAGASNYYGIRAIGNTFASTSPNRMALIGFGGTSYGNNFLSCRDNISLESNMDGRIQNNYMRNITYHGVWAINNVSGYLDILNNQFISGNSDAYGTLIFQHTNSIVQIENNRFNGSASSIPSRLGAGVYIGNVVAGAYQTVPKIRIKDNFISNSVYGILTSNVTHPFILNNDIRWTISQNEMNADPVYAYTGIYLAGSPYAEVYRNNIQNLSAYNPITASINEYKLRGIRLENSPSSKVKENYMLKTPAGFNAVYQNGSSEIHCNTFARNRWGFFFEKAEIGDQGFGPNVSTSLVNGFGADNKWTLNPPTWERSDGTRLPPVNGSLEYYHTALAPNPNQYLSTPTFLLDFLNNYDNNVIIGSSPTTQPRSACGGEIPPWISLPDVAANRRKEYGRFIDGTIPDSNEYVPQQRYAKEHTFRKMSNDSSYLFLGAPDDTLYINFIQEFQNSETKKIIDAQNSINSEDYLSAESIHSTISSNCFHSENNKLVQQIYLESLDSGLVIISLADSLFLEFMACQDPLDYGNAVYQARSMIGWLHSCSNPTQNKSMNSNQSDDDINPSEILDNNVIVYPNPTKGDIIVQSFEVEITGINVRDLNGKVIFTQNYDEHEVMLNLLNQSPGIYFIEIITVNNETHREKLVIE